MTPGPLEARLAQPLEIVVGIDAALIGVERGQPVEGRFLTCSEGQHEVLFWALRGGGGNFGVVTSFEYRLHEVADILGEPTFYPLEAVLGITLGPPLPFVPEQWHGRPVVVVVRTNYRQNYDRLVEIKTRYDPTNLFRLNQNIAPVRLA